MGAKPSTPLSQCLSAAVPNVAFSNKIGYQLTDVRPYNLNIKVAPIAIGYPTTTQHVQAIIKCAAQNGANVQAKSGGHSYGNYGMLLLPFVFMEDKY
jgi:hypothetical protein